MKKDVENWKKVWKKDEESAKKRWVFPNKKSQNKKDEESAKKKWKLKMMQEVQKKDERLLDLGDRASHITKKTNMIHRNGKQSTE